MNQLIYDTEDKVSVSDVALKTKDSIDRFLSWKNSYGYFSYDLYDLWSTEYGLWSKKIYYHNKGLGSVFVSPVFLIDLLIPSVRKWLVTKKRFPIGDAHFLMAYLNLYEYDGRIEYLDEAEKLADDLLKSSIPGYSGHCWGYPFDWMTTRGLWKSGIPLMTTTVYCFEAFLKLYDATGNNYYLEIAHSVLLFTMNDITDHKIDDNISVCSYSPVDNSQIINANAYRSFVLVEGYKRFKDEKALERAKRNINFILKSQRDNGSWLYSANDERDDFVDNFHTCFVLKNLLKVNAVLQDEKILNAILKGFDFYKKHLLTEDYKPKPFAKLSRFNIVNTELYDYAEGISLCLQMHSLDSSALAIAEKMADDVTSKYQKSDGSYYTRINVLNIPNKIPYLRWSQAQLYYGLTNYLLFLKGIN